MVGFHFSMPATLRHNSSPQAHPWASPAASALYLLLLLVFDGEAEAKVLENSFGCIVYAGSSRYLKFDQ